MFMDDESYLVTLRAHHLLCLQGYQGYGYDERFKVNLEKKLKILKNHNTKVIVSSSPDDLCEKCPNLKENICVGIGKSFRESLLNNEKIVKKDLAILKEIKIKSKKKYSFKELIKIVNNVFTGKNQLKYICNDCQWTNECLWYQSKEL